jgi:hypothetical protein
VSIFVWLSKVYGKFKTTECLPTEIGLTTVFSICIALLFFGEYQYTVDVADLPILCVSALLILFGIGLMSMDDAVDASYVDYEEHLHLRASIVEFGFQLPFNARQKWKASITSVIALNRIAEPMHNKRHRQQHRGQARGGSVMVENKIHEVDMGIVSLV